MQLLPTAALAVALCAVGVPPDASSAKQPRGQWRFASYGPDEGLRNLVNRHVVQTADRFIWVSSDDGLFRFDGDRFTRFGTDDGLPSTQITYLHPAADGRLLVATRKGLAMVKGSAITVGTEVGGPTGRVVAAGSSTALGVWIGTPSGVFREDTPGHFAPVTDYPGKGVTALHIDGGRAFVGHNETLFAFDGRDWSDLSGTLPVHQGTLPKPTARRIDRIHTDGKGQLWLRTPYHWWSGRPGQPLRDVSAALGSFGTNGYQVADRRGGIWAMVNTGLAHAAPDGSLRRFGVQELPTPWTWSMLEDHEGTLWLAGLGVHRLLGRRLWSSFTTANGLSNDIIYPIVRDSKGVLWLGTDTGLSRSVGGRFEAVEGTADLTVRDFVVGPDGSRWFGGVPAVLARMAPDGTLTRYGAAHGIAASRLMAIVPAQDGGLWLATDGGGLLHAPSWKDPAFQRVALPDGKPDELVSDLRRDASGRLWAGGEKGLAVRVGQSWKRLGKAQGLRADGVTVLGLRADGRVCAAYFEALGASCFRYDVKGHRATDVTHFDVAAGLSSNRIYSLGEDTRGRLWVGTGAGLDIVEGGRTREHYGQSDGLPGDDCDARSFLAEPDGTVWIGTSTGLARFDGGAYQGPVPAPTIAFLNAQVGARQAPLTDAIELEPGENRLAVRYTAMSFANPRRLSFQVRLGDEPWRAVAGREVSYQGVEPGEYRMQVRSRFGPGPWGEPAVTTVRVKPTFWQTGWAIGLLILLAGALVGGGVRWRLSSLRRRNVELETTVRSRTRELREANDRLREQSLTDPLTKLRNRRFLAMALPKDTDQARRSWDPRALEGEGVCGSDLLFLLIDVDHFKQVNDEHGHDAGDRVLEQVAHRLRKTLRGGDMAIRWGGEEFLVVARDTDRATAPRLAERICEAMRSEPFNVGEGRTLARTVSVGAAALPFIPAEPDAIGWETVVAMADQALYLAKNEGRDRWVVVTSGEGLKSGISDAALKRDFGRLVDGGGLAVTRANPGDD